jgi:hypothetical protein
VRVAEPLESPDAAALLTASGIAVTTMGRTVDEDPLFFAAAAAAGALAARMVLEGSSTGTPDGP